MIECLKDLKNEGKELIIISNNYLFMIEWILDYCFGNEWKYIFDLVIGNPHKPKFFH